MTEDPKKTLRKIAGDIDLNLGGLFESLGTALNEAVKRLDQAGSGDSEASFDTSKGPVRAQGGIRVRMGGLDTTAASKPQPINPLRSRQTVQKPTPARVLTYDLIEDDTVWILTAEVPGAAIEDLTLAIEGSDLVLQIQGLRPCQARIPMPVACALDQIQAALRNGILTLKFVKEPT